MDSKSSRTSKLHRWLKSYDDFNGPFVSKHCWEVPVQFFLDGVTLWPRELVRRLMSQLSASSTAPPSLVSCPGYCNCGTCADPLFVMIGDHPVILFHENVEALIVVGSDGTSSGLTLLIWDFLLLCNFDLWTWFLGRPPELRDPCPALLDGPLNSCITSINPTFTSVSASSLCASFIRADCCTSWSFTSLIAVPGACLIWMRVKSFSNTLTQCIAKFRRPSFRFAGLSYLYLLDWGYWLRRPLNKRFPAAYADMFTAFLLCLMITHCPGWCLVPGVDLCPYCVPVGAAGTLLWPLC